MTFDVLVKIIALAFSLGLDALSVAIGIGLQGVSGNRKLKIGLSFAGFQVGLPILGLLVSRVLSERYQTFAAYAGFALLAGLGLHMVWQAKDAFRLPAAAKIAPVPAGFDLSRGWGLIFASISVSLDALGAGFSLVAIAVPIVPALIAIGVAAFVMTFAGLQFGHLLGRRVERWSELAAGILLTILGVAFALERAFFE